MSRINDEINKKLGVVNSYINAFLIALTSEVVKLEITDLIDVASVFLPLLQNVSASTDRYFENLHHTESLDSSGMDSESCEPPNIIEEILADVEEPITKPEEDLYVHSQVQTTSPSDKSIVESESSFLTLKGNTEVVGLSDFKETVPNMYSWRDICDDSDLLECKDERLLTSVNSSEIISDAIPVLDYSKLLDNGHLSASDYYMLPFTCSVAEHDLEKLDDGTNPLKNSESEDPNASTLQELRKSSANSSLDYYLTFPGGGLKPTLSVLQEMEVADENSFPYTALYQKEKHPKMLKPMQSVTHMQPNRSLRKDVLFNFTTHPLSQFVLINSEDITRMRKFYLEVQSFNEDLEPKLKYLQTRVMRTKRALYSKKHELIKKKQELDTAMKSKFGCVVDLDLLQDAIENPHFHIKKHEYQGQLEKLKKKLKIMKESESAALQSFNELRFQDTKICFELYELRRDFDILDKSYSSKYKVLPKIGEITEYAADEE